MHATETILLGLLDRLAAEEEPEHLLKTALAGITEWVRAERGFVMLRSGGRRMRVVAAKNIGQDRILGDDFRPFRKVAEAVVNDGRAFFSTDARKDLGLVETDPTAGGRTHAVLVVPWRVGPRIQGALYVDAHTPDGTAFSEEAAHGVQVLADVAARMADLGQREAELATEMGALRDARDALERNNTSLQEDFAAKSMELATVERALQSTHRALASHYSFQNIVGRSPPMQGMFDLIHQVVDYPVPVLITGESGTGKELCARALHFGGARADEPFMAINCAAIPENLLESELFGYRRGAFTGADRDKDGLFRAAAQGSVFLDEIGEMPMTTQVKLLRVLQEREVRPVGGTEPVPVTARILAATNRDLEAEVRAQRFREDLFYRLNVVHVRVPSLSERVEDIAPLVEHFLDRLAEEYDLPRKQFSNDALQRLMRHPWPGNVRQLENAVKSTVILSRGATIGPDELRLPATAGSEPTPGAPAPQSARIRSRSDWEAHERERILGALVDAGWNKTRAAQQLGVSRRNLYRKLARYGIEGAT